MGGARTYIGYRPVHILTKIFVVLVSLLAVFMVPLVVVSTLNQEHWRGEAIELQTQVRSARNDLQQARAQVQGQIASMNEELTIVSLRDQNRVSTIETLASANTRLEAELLEARSNLTSRQANTRALHTSLTTSNELSEMLITNLDRQRSQALNAEKARVELDERLAEAEAQLQVASDVTHVLQEENELLKRDQQRLSDQLNQYTVTFGALDNNPRTQEEGIAPDRNLSANVIDIARGDTTLVEIDAGSRDGVKEGWVMTVGDDGTFIGRLRIIKVDLNRATGVLTLEDPGRGLAETGHRVYAMKDVN